MNEHVIVADYRQETLFLHTDSSAWTETIRYLTPEILALFRDELPGIRTVRIKNPPVRPPVQAARRVTAVSPDTAKAIRQTADEITDAPLRSVLLRIADKLLAGSWRE